MKEINIGKVLAKKRKEKGITQEELAHYMGVSKASVSKWETAQSYPDITLLPVLATYFSMSIDDLMDYQPQMTKEDISKLYRRLSADFTWQPFDVVLAECRQIIKKYYSCFPLLLQMGTLLLNHVELLKGAPPTVELIQEARNLFIRVKEESDDVSLARKALYMEAYCALVAGDAVAVLDLLDGTIEPAMPPEVLMASAYQIQGQVEDAEGILQIGIYQSLVVLFNFFPAYLRLCTADTAKFEEVLRRALSMADLFDMRHLHPGVLIGTYVVGAQGYLAQDNHDRALDMLQQYTDIVTDAIYPLKLHGDEFFDRLEQWLLELDFGQGLPRDDKTIKRSMCDVVVENPGFSMLADNHRFNNIVSRLQNNCSSE